MCTSMKIATSVERLKYRKDGVSVPLVPVMSVVMLMSCCSICKSVRVHVIALCCLYIHVHVVVHLYI